MKQNKETLKKYFETGDKPTQQQYAELIDSYVDSKQPEGKANRRFVIDETGEVNIAEEERTPEYTLSDIVNNKLSLLKDGITVKEIDLTPYVDDTNLARLVSGTVDNNGVATFTRDDNSNFTVDLSNLKGSGAVDVSNLIPYTGATQDVDLGDHYLKLGKERTVLNKAKHKDLLYLGANSYLKSQTYSYNGVTYTPVENIGLGRNAINNNIGHNVIGVGLSTAYNNTGNYVIALGNNVLVNNTGSHVVGIGNSAGQNNTGSDAVLLGDLSGSSNEGEFVIGIGSSSMQNNTSNNSVGVGYQAGQNNTGNHVTLIGRRSGQNNSGSSAIGIGDYSMRDNKGASSIGIGDYSMKDNKGASSIGIGYSAVRNNTGLRVLGIGDYAMSDNTGIFSMGIGYNSGVKNRGKYAIGLGCESINFNTGDNGIGYQSLRYNTGSNNTAIGNRSWHDFNSNIVYNITNGDITNSTNTITLNAHGLGAVNSEVNLKFTLISGTAPIGLSNTSIYQFKILSENEVQLISGNISSDGSGLFTLTSQHQYINTTVLGYNSQPTKSNQVVLGSTATEEVTTAKDYKSTGSGYGVILKTPDGSKDFRISIDNSGNVVTTQVV